MLIKSCRLDPERDLTFKEGCLYYFLSSAFSDLNEQLFSKYFGDWVVWDALGQAASAALSNMFC